MDDDRPRFVTQRIIVNPLVSGYLGFYLLSVSHLLPLIVAPSVGFLLLSLSQYFADFLNIFFLNFK